MLELVISMDSFTSQPQTNNQTQTPNNQTSAIPDFSNRGVSYVLSYLKEQKLISVDDCCSLHCDKPYFVYIFGSRAIVKCGTEAIHCCDGPISLEYRAHCLTFFRNRDVLVAAKAFGHRDVLEAFNLHHSKPSYSRKVRVCGAGCVWCGCKQCKCVVSYSDSSDNDESVDFDVDDDTGVARVSFGTLINWRKNLPKMATTQADPTHGIFHSVAVFFSAACNSVKALGESAIKAILRALFGYAVDVLKEYLPHVNWEYLKFVALMVMTCVMHCMGVNYVLRTCFVQFVAIVMKAQLSSRLFTFIFDAQATAVEELAVACARACTQGPADLVAVLEKIVLGMAAYGVAKIVPSDKGVMDFLIKCDRIPKAAKGLGNIAEYLTAVWKYIRARLASYMGWEQEIDSEIPQDVRNNYEEIVALGHSDLRAQIPLDPAIRERVKASYLAYWRLRRIYSPSRTIMTFMDKYAGLVSTLMSKTSDSTAGQTESRQKPVVTFLRGGTGVGKSELLYFMGTDVLVHLKAVTPDMTDEELKRKINSCMYPRYIENEYWDSYSEQPICLYDDFGQVTDSPQNPNLEFMELIRSANRFPYALHMADISSKNNTFFKSKFIFATTNLPSIDPRSVVDPAAVRSRIDFGFEVSVREEFQVNPSGSLPEDHKLDRNKVAHLNGPSLDVYEFRMWDPVNSTVGEDTITFGAMMRLIKNKQVEFERHHHISSDTFVSYARDAFQREQDRQNAQYPPEVHAHTQGWPTDAVRKLRMWVAPNVERAPEHPMEFATRLLITEIVYECEKLLEKSDRIMEEVWRKINSYSPITMALLAIVGTILAMLVYYFTRSRLSSDEEVLKQMSKERRAEILGWMDLSEKKYFKKTKNFPPRIRSALEKGTAPVELYNPALEGVEEAYRCALMYECALEQFMTPEEYESYCETNVLPVEVLDRLPLDRNIETTTESGRDLPKIVARVEGMFAKTQAFTSKQCEEVVHKLRTNQFYIDAAKAGGQTHAQVFAVGGTKMLVNRHYWENFPEVFWLCSYDSSSRIEIRKDEITIQELPRDLYVDAVLMNMPARVGMKKSMWHHFIRKKDLISIGGKHALLASKEFDGTSRILGGKILSFETEEVVLDFKPRRMTYFRADIRTQDGDCGAIAVLDDNTFAGKICGFHFAGFNAGGAMSVPLVYEDFEVLMQNTPELRVPACVEPNPDPRFRHAHSQGKVARGVNNPTRTSFVQTAAYGLLEPSEVAPAVLAPLSRDDGPGKKALAKVDQDVPWIDPEDILQAKESFKEVLFSFPRTNRKILTFEEAVQGCDEIAFAKGINRSHSAGYPWMLETSKGKRKFFGEDEWDVTGPNALRVKAEVERRIALMKQGKYEPCLYVDTLKDETRDLERVALGKTRVFSAAPMDYIILMRMYFMSFFSFVMLNRNFNEISVGTQAQSPDWDLLARRLLSNRGGIVAGDFSNFDGTLHSEILLSVRDIVNEWYDDGPENRQIRNLIFEDVVHSWHLTEKEVNSWNHSQPSGNPGTAIFNSMYNSLVMRLCYYELAKNEESTGLDTFNRNVVMVSYGDDNVLSVSPSAFWYNQSSITEVMKKYGMTYTLETKSGEAGTFRTLEEVQYLQRAFRFEPKISMWVAPLKKRSINERLNWNKKTPSPVETLVENARGAIAEWALHDEETYEDWAHRINNVLVSSVGRYISFRRQGYYLGFVRSGEYGTAFPAVSYA